MVESRSRRAAEEPDQRGHHERTDERTRNRVVGHQQPGHGTGERELAGAVHGEGHGARDDEGSDEAAAHRHEERGLEGVLGKGELEVEADAHQWPCSASWSCAWCGWAPGSVGSFVLGADHR